MLKPIPLLLAALLLTIHSTHAASGAWTGGADGYWNDNVNWTGASHPGPGQTATFDVEATDSFISMNGAAISVGSIVFVDGPGSYTFNADEGSLSVANITVDANVTGTVTQIFNARLEFPNGGNAFMTNDSASAVLDFRGGVDNGSEEKHLHFYVNGSGIVALNGASSMHGKSISIAKTNSGKLIMSGALSGLVGYNLDGSGVLQFNSTETTTTGSIVIRSGIIGLGVENFTRAIGSGGDQVRWTTLNGDTGFAAYGANRSVNMGGFSESFSWGQPHMIRDGQALVLGSSDSTHTLDFQNQLNLADAERNLVVHDGTNTSNIDGEISGVISSYTNSLGAVTKAGAGTLLLSAENLYTGLTTVRQGTLLVGNRSGSGSLAGEVSVASGAALGGSGSIAGAVTIDGSLRPGDGTKGVGALTVQNSVTWNGGENWVFELGAAAANPANAGRSVQDQLIIAEGDFRKGSGETWSFDFAGTGAVGWYKIVDWTGTTSFNSGDFTALNLAPGLSGSFSVDGRSSALYLRVVK